MRRKFVLAIAVAVVVVSTAPGIAVAAPTRAGGDAAGTHSLGVTVTDDDGEALDGIPVTVIDKKTGKQVFSGFTDNAGQIDVTLPRGNYEVVAQSQKKTVTLNKDDTQTTFTLASDELPKAPASPALILPAEVAEEL